MRILFISYNFPPEVNALARRTYEHAREWVRTGCEVDVITDVPHFPEGKVYSGYRNRYSRDTVDGIRVFRVPLFIHENEGVVRRSLSFVTFMLSATWFSRRAHRKPDVVIASSPQFLAGLAGWLISAIKRAPFILEIRDIWPESMIATGVLSRNPLVLLLEWLEVFLYRRARHIVVVTDSFVDYLRRKGIAAEKVSVIKNGFDLQKWSPLAREEFVKRVREEYDLQNRFVVSYIGTLGRAHKAEVLWKAAERIADPDVVFMVVGTGPERRILERLQQERPLPNFRLVDKQSHERVFAFYGASDLVVVHLRDSELFRTVIPSKIFECMALGLPILLGVRGEAEALVCEAGAGVLFPPEDVDALVDVVLKLKHDRRSMKRMASAGQAWVARHHDRRVLAGRWLDLLRGLAAVDGGRQTAPRAEEVEAVS